VLHGILVEGKIEKIESDWLDLEDKLNRRGIPMAARLFSSETNEQFEIDKIKHTKLEWV
jgi:hypothetical protein